MVIHEYDDSKCIIIIIIYDSTKVLNNWYMQQHFIVVILIGLVIDLTASRISNPKVNDFHYPVPILIIPVMRRFGSNTSIFSSKSTTPGDLLGNLAAKFCLGNCGSILTYLLALSLRRNPRLVSSGEPISY